MDVNLRSSNQKLKSHFGKTQSRSHSTTIPVPYLTLILSTNGRFSFSLARSHWSRIKRQRDSEREGEQERERERERERAGHFRLLSLIYINVNRSFTEYLAPENAHENSSRRRTTPTVSTGT